jgi:hypothetical protein
MRMVKLWVIMLLVFGLCCPSMAQGKVEQEVSKGIVSEDMALKEGTTESGQKEEEPPGTFGPILTDTADPVDVGTLELQPFWSFGFVTGAFNDHARQVSADGNFYSFGFDLQVTYGAWNNLEVFTVIPVAVNWANSVNETGPSGERDACHGGFGDVNLTFKYRFVKETDTLPTVSGIFAVDFPTGKYRSLNPRLLGIDAIGGGSYVFTTGLNVSKWMKPFIFYGNLYYSMPTSYTDDDMKVLPRDFVTVNLAAEYPITEKWIALLELTSFWEGNRIWGKGANTSPANLLSILPGIEFMATDKLSFALGVNVDLAGRNIDATVTPILSMVWGVH